jgi:hypothetical protein
MDDIFSPIFELVIITLVMNHYVRKPHPIHAHMKNGDA